MAFAKRGPVANENAPGSAPEGIFTGVLPAITTPFHDNGSIDHAGLAEHCQWLLRQGVNGLIALGSLGEGATLGQTEKRDVLDTCLRSADRRGPVIAAVSALSTREAVELARDADKLGCSGLMVLPPYVYSTDWYEMKAHVAAVLSATNLPCMLYNNPIAYQTDFVPDHIA